MAPPGRLGLHLARRVSVMSRILTGMVVLPLSLGCGNASDSVVSDGPTEGATTTGSTSSGGGGGTGGDEGGLGGTAGSTGGGTDGNVTSVGTVTTTGTATSGNTGDTSSIGGTSTASTSSGGTSSSATATTGETCGPCPGAACGPTVTLTIQAATSLGDVDLTNLQVESEGLGLECRRNGRSCMFYCEGPWVMLPDGSYQVTITADGFDPYVWDFEIKNPSDCGCCGCCPGTAGANVELTSSEEPSDTCCADTDIDPLNCGACGNECESGASCIDGTCQSRG